MLLLGVVTFSIAIPLCSNTVNAFHYTRLAVIIFIMSGLLTIEVINIGEEDYSIYCSLVFQSDRTHFMEVLLLMVGSLSLITFHPGSDKKEWGNKCHSTFSGVREDDVIKPSVSSFEEDVKGEGGINDVFEIGERGGGDVRGHSDDERGVSEGGRSASDSGINGEGDRIPKEYSLVVIFSVIGASIILSSYNLISIYLATELQSFALYIIAALSRDSLRSVQASLKYFILGAWSSAFILLGAGIIYTCTGSTSLVDMSNWISSTSTGGPWSNASLGLMFIYSGYIFKVSAAPFHNWAPDVYQNTPTVVTMMLITLPKISIMTALFTLTKELIDTKVVFILLVVAIASLVIGTVTGLVQTQLRRLLAYSTISHVGFIVICLSLETESSNNALIFYIVQYSLSTLLMWNCITAIEAGERKWMMLGGSVKGRVNYISDLRQSFSRYSIITFSIVISLFSMSGLPPLVGFIAKINVLWSSVEEGAIVMFIIAIMSSVVSASYYLKTIKIIMFDEPNQDQEFSSRVIPLNTNNTDDSINGTSNISPIHAYSISTCTAFLSLFILDSELLINSIELALNSI
ncbi:NADH dehydrogenase subunit 2 (mitochondrion) [Puccinia striiformis f. sp. tritici PST-78]|uniref:NADH-ubiquinone oxidoreductase chain 2 n=2 Tax=Puccinia striiformis f. sp. tritici TaxID=168172 RepID=A0A0L0W6P0_9BASI|nr:NADH dehydrogenase subunit 2 [Puccinia striiformis f. sp. tritici]AYM32563.1 NADH dehydrogenase subunit 2 [Puccinia striiformis f. sp. tritici]KNF06925.1 NADH dehydrogenase subunit 2 [Puccinia striiformis f. sp. tritici PST-78]QHS71079.1 NADH dehydrogenase subunit 2 [Puccinia striiformis f. sp. tritici]